MHGTSLPAPEKLPSQGERLATLLMVADGVGGNASGGDASGMVDRGALSPKQLDESPFSHVLSSAIGGEEAVPEVTRLNLGPDSVSLLCSDGLTKHVTNTEIGDHIKRMKSSEQLCRSLLGLALERGGTDNITVLAGRAKGTRT